jgi:hypothetical protein
VLCTAAATAAALALSLPRDKDATCHSRCILHHNHGDETWGVFPSRNICMNMCMCVGVCLSACVCEYVCVCVVLPVLPGLPVEPIWPHWRPRVGSLPIRAGLRYRPGVRPCVAPRPVQYALRPEPGSLPQDHHGSGVVPPWLPSGHLHNNSSMSPSSPCRPVCCVCIGAFTAGGARGSEAASPAYSIWRFPQKGCPRRTACLQTFPIRISIPRPVGCENNS